MATPKSRSKLLTKAGNLKCPTCKEITTPKLVERGYIVTHNLIRIEGKTVKARGWDGDSSDVSETGDSYWLACTSCWNEVPLPEGMEVDWL